MTSFMPEGANVPPVAIPAAAWGISGQALSTEEIMGQDPFEGHGLRLDGIPGRVLTVQDVQEGTGLEQVIVVGGRVIWVRLGYDSNAADVLIRWQAWLTREEVTTEDT